MKAQPQPKANQLIKQINELRTTAGQPDAVGLQRIQRAAEKLMESDVCSAHSILGMVAALRHDVDAAKAHHALAINLATPGERTLEITQYACSLSKLWLAEDAMWQQSQAVELAPENLLYLRELIDYSARSGHLRDAERWLDTWHKRAVDQEPPAREQTYRQVAAFVKDRQITDEDIASRLRDAVEVANRHGVRLEEACSIDTYADDSDTWIGYELRAYASPETIAEMTVDLAALSAERREPSRIGVGLSVCYTVAKDDDERNVA
jgi:hypothetical protein